MDRRKENKRPMKTTPEEDQEIIECVEEQPFNSIASTINETGVDVSVNTVRRRLKYVDVTAHRPSKKNPLTLQQRQARVQFAQEHEHWTPEQWSRVIWSDEKVFRYILSK